MTLRKLKLVFLCGCLFSVIIKSHCQSLFDYSNSLKYADYLFQTRQFNYSVIEYERLSFLEPHDTLVKLRLVQSYRFLNDFKSAQKKLESYFPADRALVPVFFGREYVKVLVLDHQYKSAFSFLQVNNKIEPLIKTEYQVGTLLLQCKWQDAKLFTEEHVQLNQRSPELNSLYDIAVKGTEIRYKSATGAALMSAIIPGSGKIYTSRWKDAIYSFLFVGATGWMTYYSAHNYGLNFSTVLLGTITCSFYAANIYGSYKSAGIYNQKINNGYKKEVENIILRE